MAYDPTKNAEKLAILTARAFTTYPQAGGQFTLASAATTRLGGNHPAQPWFRPSTASRTAIAWSAVYRGVKLPGYLLVADTANVELAKAAALQSAVEAFDLTDMRQLRAGAGNGAGAFGVLPGKPAPLMSYDPTLQGDARWINYPR